MTACHVRLTLGFYAHNTTRWCAYIDEIKQGEEEEKRKQDVLKRVVMRITHRALSTCLLLWAEHTIEEVEKRTRMRRILLRMTGDLLGRSYPLQPPS